MNIEVHVGSIAGSRLVADYLAGNQDAQSFFAGDFRDPDAYRRKAAEVEGRFAGGGLSHLADMVVAPSDRAAHRLERVVKEGGFVVTTGQQPGLFSGPLYSVYKGLTAARLASALEDWLQKPVLPVFWVASEDHDWAESNHTHVVDRDNDLRTISLPDREGELSPPIHAVPLGDAALTALDELDAALPASDFASAWMELLRGSYTADATLDSGFHQVLQRLLGPLGVAFVDAADPALKAHSRPVLERELERAEKHEMRLAERAKALEGAGYDVQVPILEGGVNVFLEAEGSRQRLYRAGEGEAGFTPRHGDRVWSPEALSGLLDDEPGRLSPNVLLRPVVESHVLPTVAYVGGPGELAYFAQLEPLFEAHDIQPPVVYPRASVRLVEGKIRKVLDKFGLSESDLDRPFHELASDLARDEVPADVRRALGEVRGALSRAASLLTKATRSIDPTLKGPVGSARNSSLAAFGELEKKIVTALKRQNEIALGQLQKAQDHLFPFGKPQERVLNVFYYLFRYGPDLVPYIYERISVDLGSETG